ncbi:MAG: hypothetical protein E6J90_02385 [Deltaproteobacteria bacterium]|nr:MAG: hypothetical protein E6J91_47535 [Deltaproteobacteria bacterium]TMQ27556.1 MAG: hypothetical protein E6J90_02385 [Deltaproteobacteria bacterium]
MLDTAWELARLIEPVRGKASALQVLEVRIELEEVTAERAKRFARWVMIIAAVLVKVVRFMPGAIALAGMAPACGSGSTHAPADPDGHIVTVTTGLPPALIAFRDDLSTDWIGLPVQRATKFDITTHGAYQVVVACSGGDQDSDVSIVLYGRTPDDDPSIDGICDTAQFEVRGSMLQAGEVALGDGTEGSSATFWDFDLLTRPGTFDLVLLSLTSAGVPSSVAFRRDIAIVADKNLGAIDLTKEASQPLVPVSFTIANLQAGEATRSNVSFFAGNTRAQVFSLDGSPPGLTAQLAPGSALRPTDSQHVVLYASSRDAATSLTRSRSLGRDVRVGDLTSWTLPDPIGPVTFETTADRLTATWSTLPDHDEIELLREGIGSQFNFQIMLLSRSFLEATGATSATLDFHAIPGFKSQWQQDPAASQLRELVTIRRVSATETAIATVRGITSASSARSALPADPGAGRRATWFVPGRPDRWLTIPRRSPARRGLDGRP